MIVALLSLYGLQLNLFIKQSIHCTVLKSSTTLKYSKINQNQ